jgi:hypothetical protein
MDKRWIRKTVRNVACLKINVPAARDAVMYALLTSESFSAPSANQHPRKPKVL